MDQTTPMMRRWWGRVTVEEGDRRFWHLGAMKLWLARTAHEWRVTWERPDDPLESAFVVDAPPPEEPSESAQHRRFGFRATDDELRLLPALADRPMVVSPEVPFSLAPGEEVTIHVSTPVWLRIEAGAEATLLFEEPLYRPSDTWFGPSKLEGEFCYSVRTGGRMRRDELPVRPHRAISAVRIHNRASTLLPLEKLRLPLPNLSVFGSDDGQLWTESISLERDEDGDLAALEQDDGPPPDAAGAVALTGPREPIRRGLLVRAFGGVFGAGRD